MANGAYESDIYTTDSSDSETMHTMATQVIETAPVNGCIDCHNLNEHYKLPCRP